MTVSRTRPDEGALRRFLAAQARCDFSYREVGASRGGRLAGYNLDHNRVRLGDGEATFAAACAAIRAWRMFPGPWTEIWPPGSPVEAGTVVVILFRLFGLWWTSACRIVYGVDEESPIRRFGFAYGTLPGHVETGEERFTVELHASGAVWYDIRAFSHPRHPLARLGYPLARRLQRRFVRESKAAMLRACGRSPGASGAESR